MDYMQSSVSFKVRKVLRYARLYGPERTYAKVLGQRHTRRRFVQLPELPAARVGGHVGLIGAGNYAFTTIAHYVERNSPGAIRAVMDVDVHRAASLGLRYGAAYYTDEAQRIIDDPAVTLVYVASNHSTHATYAAAALRAGKAVHVEKPHVVSPDQLLELLAAMEESGRPLAIGYNRPASELGELLQKALAEQQGAGMYSWFVAGHELPADHWYYADAEGGRVLGNMCHWIDFLFQLVPSGSRYPVTITPTVAAQADCDVAVCYVFGDGTIGVITFSAKGHTFEGVREYFSGHKGDALVALQDFQRLIVDVGPRRDVHRLRWRDHGHERRIVKSLRMVDEPALGDPMHYVRETGQLMLETRRALESGTVVRVEGP